MAGNFVTGNIGIGHLKTGQQSHLDNSVNAYDIDSQQPCYYPCPAIMPTPVRTGSPVDILPALKDGACRALGKRSRYSHIATTGRPRYDVATIYDRA
ncbi:MAG: hypothetical protein OXC07_05935 [Kistimonas sp.]|nr:hypothetical protein [Kistimonas sp.]